MKKYLVVLFISAVLVISGTYDLHASDIYHMYQEPYVVESSYNSPFEGVVYKTELFSNGAFAVSLVEGHTVDFDFGEILRGYGFDFEDSVSEINRNVTTGVAGFTLSGRFVGIDMANLSLHFVGVGEPITVNQVNIHVLGLGANNFELGALRVPLGTVNSRPAPGQVWAQNFSWFGMQELRSAAHGMQGMNPVQTPVIIVRR